MRLLSKILSYWNAFSNLGVLSMDSIQEKRNKIFLNRFILIYLILRFSLVVHGLIFNLHKIAFVSSIIISLLLVLMYLIKMGYHKIVKNIYLLFWIIPPYFVIIDFDNSSLLHIYLLFQFNFQLVTISIIFILFDWKSERKNFITIIILCILNYLFYDTIVSFYVSSVEIQNIYYQNFATLKIAFIILLILVTWTSFVNKSMINEYETYLQKLNEQLLNKNEEIFQTNQKLEQANEELLEQSEELFALNNNLENIVDEKISEIVAKNKKLEEYAFFNAHKVRGPLARILGLCLLLEEFPAMNMTERDFIIDNINKSAKELDEVVKTINDILDEEKYI
jgi:signal transduction histidine kinase